MFPGEFFSPTAALALIGEATPNPQRYDRGQRTVATSQYGSREGYGYRDVLDAAHRTGEFLGVFLTPLESGPERYSFIATALFKSGIYQNVGDADDANTDKSETINEAKPRMAATRAIVRALSLALNLDKVANEETRGQYADFEQRGGGGGQRVFDNPPPNDGAGGYMCETCEAPITDAPKKGGGTWSAEALAGISHKKFGAILCLTHQPKKS